MICPHCKKSYDRNNLVRLNIKTFENVDLEYDAVCPYCKVVVGKMFWGKFTLLEDSDHMEPVPLDQLFQPPNASKPTVVIRYMCPHCAEILPEDLSTLPRVRGEGDRRQQADRRSGNDRRQRRAPWRQPEARKGERRQQADRRQPGPDRREMPAGVLSAETENAQPSDNRKTERRKNRRPVLYDRRQPGSDRREEAASDKVNWKI